MWRITLLQQLKEWIKAVTKMYVFIELTFSTLHYTRQYNRLKLEEQMNTGKSLQSYIMDVSTGDVAACWD